MNKSYIHRSPNSLSFNFRLLFVSFLRLAVHSSFHKSVTKLNFYPVHFSYNPYFSGCFFSWNSIFLSQQINRNSVLASFFSEVKGPSYFFPPLPNYPNIKKNSFIPLILLLKLYTPSVSRM